MKKQEISIPKGCKKVEIDHENGVVIMHVEEEKMEFKRGDFLQSINSKRQLIYLKKLTPSSFESIWNNKGVDNNDWATDCFRHATPEEAQLLFDKLEEEGYKWNAETLELEKIEKFEYRQLTLMRDEDDEIWLPEIFSHYDSKHSKYYGLGVDGNPNIYWNQCSKFDPELMGTTNKPKQ